ncbi:MAG: MerR family transcriptional regulator [Oscillospiraceae bacterium]|nr:MerR family transcriptional regulator [Oscillospiraceae bacterium]
MGDLVKIRDLSLQYGISARTLRYYEEMGLIKSTRKDNYAYRFYDKATVQRLEQILMLRKLNISIKDIQHIFSSSNVETILEVLQKKVNTIDQEVLLLHELKEIVLEFITQIKQSDFNRESDIKQLYTKASEIETQIKSADYTGNPSPLNRLIEITEKLDDKVPDITIVKLPPFRAVTSGRTTFNALFADFMPWQEQHKHLFVPIIFDSCDFLSGRGEEFEWFWAVGDTVTELETCPYQIVVHPGGLYATAVSIDGDGTSHNKVREKISKWLENTNFILDEGRDFLGHMIYADEEIKAGLGYHQMILYTPIRLKDGI